MRPQQPDPWFWENLRNPWYWLAAGLLTVYARGLFLDVMDVDASQYASISMEMFQGGHWLEVQHRHADYLDKPPLLFWVSASSFAVFGLHNWAYKLPSVLAALLGIYATYRFCLLYYPKNTARQAAFILASSMGVLLLCNDVRTDTLLMAMTVCAVWQLGEWLTPPPPRGRVVSRDLGGWGFQGLPAPLSRRPLRRFGHVGQRSHRPDCTGFCRGYAFAVAPRLAAIIRLALAHWPGAGAAGIGSYVLGFVPAI